MWWSEGCHSNRLSRPGRNWSLERRAQRTGCPPGPLECLTTRGREQEWSRAPNERERCGRGLPDQSLRRERNYLQQRRNRRYPSDSDRERQDGIATETRHCLEKRTWSGHMRQPHFHCHYKGQERMYARESGPVRCWPPATAQEYRCRPAWRVGSTLDRRQRRATCRPTQSAARRWRMVLDLVL